VGEVRGRRGGGRKGGQGKGGRSGEGKRGRVNGSQHTRQVNFTGAGGRRGQGAGACRAWNVLLKALSPWSRDNSGSKPHTAGEHVMLRWYL
jgi:hypothetical protein